MRQDAWVSGPIDTSRWQRMASRLGLPSIRTHRRFVAAIVIDALGSGVFMPLTFLYFLATTRLTLVQVGAAVTVASLLTLPAGPLIGSVVDRVGAKRVLLAGNLLQAAGMFGFLVVESTWSLIWWTTVVTLGRTAFWGSYGNILAVISPPGEREKWFGLLGALRNLSFALGGLLSGVVLAVGTPLAFHATVAGNAVSFLVAFALLLKTPDSRDPHAQPRPGAWGTVLADKPFRWLLASQFGYSMAMNVLNFAIPVYVVESLGVPGPIASAIFVINCLIVGFGQSPAVASLTGAVRWQVIAAAHACFALAFAIMLGASRLPLGAAAVTLILGGVVYTIAEIAGGPVLSALAVESSAPELRGRYLSLVQLIWTLTTMVAPAAFAWLLASGDAPLWWSLIALSLLALLATVGLGRHSAVARAPITNRPR